MALVLEMKLSRHRCDEIEEIGLHDDWLMVLRQRKESWIFLQLVA